MGHYPIKCVWCGKVLTNRTVLFDIKDASGGIVQHIKGDESTADPSTQADRPSAKNRGGADLSGIRANTSNAKNAKVFEHQLKDKMTYSELFDFCSERELLIKANYQDCPVSKDFLDAEGTEEQGVLTRISFQKEKDEAPLHTIRRYCPECGKPLPAGSGTMPTYLVTLLGSTASGKTVYLCALNKVLSSRGSLPYDCTLHSVPASSSSNELFKLSSDLFNKAIGTLPATTQRIVNEPLVFKLTFTIPYTYILKNGEAYTKDYKKECLFSISDMRGEDLAEKDGAALTIRGEFISHSDGFLTVISPLNIPIIASRLDETEDSDASDAERSQLVHTALMSHINDYVLPFFPTGQISAPCVTMLSKADRLVANRKLLGLLGIPASNPVLCNDPEELYTQTYFRNLHIGTAQILNLDSSLYDFLFHVFKRMYLTSVSAFGPNAKYEVITAEDGNTRKKIENPAVLAPQHVADPILLLLIQLGFLPDFTRVELGEAYEENNYAILSEWMDRCICQD